MSEVTPIRPDVAIPSPSMRKRRVRRAPGPKVSVESMDAALNDQRAKLFEAMGIVRLAIRAAQRGSGNDGSVAMVDAVDIWTALNGAYALFDRVAGKLQDSETMLAEVAP
jgi:hypothetical protein